MPDATPCSVAGCDRSSHARGWCTLHYSRWRHHGDALWQRPTLAERIEAKIKRVDGHWMWTAAVDKSTGYGIIQIGGQKGSAMKAHRVVYEHFVGPIPEGLQIDHLCRVRACVNPAHLEPVTALENNHRSPLTNSAKTHCPQGHPYDEANTYNSPEGRRVCRTCRRQRVRDFYARQKAA